MFSIESPFVFNLYSIYIFRIGSYFFQSWNMLQFHSNKVVFIQLLLWINYYWIHVLILFFVPSRGYRWDLLLFVLQSCIFRAIFVSTIGYINNFMQTWGQKAKNVLPATGRMRKGIIGTKAWSFVAPATMSICFSELC